MLGNKNNKGIYAVIGCLFVAVIALSIAYAALSANLDITFGTVTQNVLTWNVGFRTSPSSVTGTAGGTSATGRSCGTATVARKQVTVAATELSKPGDKCTWALTVKNTGSIDAVLTSITPTAPTSVACSPMANASMVCGNITYKLTTDAAGTTLLTSGGTLGHTTGSLDVYLVAEYTGADVTDTTVQHSGAKFELLYEQL